MIMVAACWVGEIMDVKGAFLHGNFDEGKNIYMKVPEGFEKYYDPMYYVLLLLQTLYGLKQSAMAFWKKLLQAFQSMNFQRSKTDPCLYYAWTQLGLVVLWLSWIEARRAICHAGIGIYWTQGQESTKKLLILQTIGVLVEELDTSKSGSTS
jgi:hypothetical protein